jgi:two-component system, OmpR family, response regulator
VARVLAAPAENASARTILVADDDPAIRSLLCAALEQHGHRVLEAGSAAEIFEALDVAHPDVLLLDVHLGPDDGLAIGAGLRQEPQHSSLKILFMSGTPGEEEVVRLSNLWHVPILVKPFDFEVLLAAIAS